MALFVLIFFVLNNCFTGLLGSKNSNDSNGVLEITPASITGGQNIHIYKVDDTLNLTCIFRNKSVLSDVSLEWVVPSKPSNSKNRVIHRSGTNILGLIVQNLQENDSGEYKCRAMQNGIPFFTSENSVRINVKSRKKECTGKMFQCSSGFCIQKRYTCDGHKDCRDGEDESPIHCGTGNPCENKLICKSENRCIPSEWCCEPHKEPNCTTKVKHSCCTHVEKLTRDVDNDFVSGYQFEQQRYNNMGFLQTTVYTVIGCAMAFMFIVIILVIAICRVHIRRTLMSRCPSAIRSLAMGPGGNVHGNHLNGLSFYDLDLYFNRPGINGNDLMSVNPLLVTYNINNGVQFVGRPIDPPPYCEIVTSPPKEGPPPPYASQENLTVCHPDTGRIEEPKSEAAEICVEPEMTECDALLGATGQSISVISCNAIDVVVPVEEITNPVEMLTETSIAVKDSFSSSKESSEMGDSSQIESGRALEEVKNSGLEILVLNNYESGVTETPSSVKVQNGESSSYVSSSVSDKSKGAVKKIVSTKSLDSNISKRKSKSFSKNHIKKF